LARGRPDWSLPRLLGLGAGGRHGRPLGGPARHGRSRGRFIEELSNSGKEKQREEARAGASTAAGRRAGASCRRAPASGLGAGSAESQGALACLPASGACAA
jgi:hypothetical protein